MILERRSASLPRLQLEQMQGIDFVALETAEPP